jgi:4-amino-4-deoxychorismate lyase
MRTWVNGRRVSTIDHRDRGLQYGDGLFETMRVERRTVRLIEYHLERVLQGCRRLKIEAPQEQRLRGELERAAKLHGSGVLKLIITRGVGPRGYRPSGSERSTRILSIAARPRARGRSQGKALTVRLCRLKLGTNEALAGLKTLNRLESVLARSEWRDPRIGEGLLRDANDHIVCGTMSNLFLRRGKLLVTPLLDRCGVAGVMRRWVLKQAPAIGLKIAIRRISLRDLRSAEEVFMTNALSGVMSVGEIRVGSRRMRPPLVATAAALRMLLEDL